MHDASEIARIADLIADPARARILWTLIDGTTRPAGELAYAANISAQSASAHLAKLVRGRPARCAGPGPPPLLSDCERGGGERNRGHGFA
jgi:DNA-binding transcriptional ArsR family regulator